VTLGGSEYLIVFASGKDRRSPGAELHANFKLDAQGEYLALVKPDGVTIATEFAPTFPPQIANASYGVLMGDRTTTLVSSAAPKRVLVPTGDLGMNWLTAEFDDRAWLLATNGVGFDAGTNYAAFLGRDLRDRMRGKNASAYVRMPFVIRDSGFEKIKLRLRYEDGFVAYLNGYEVARVNAPARPQWNSAATSAHSLTAPVAFKEDFESEGAPRFAAAQLTPQTRPKISAANAGSTGRFLRLVNGQAEEQVNSVAFPRFAPGSFETVVADFDFRWKGSGEGTDRLIIALIPTAAYGLTGDGISLPDFKNTKEPALPGVFAVVLRQQPESRQGSVSVYWDRASRLTASLPGGLINTRGFHHARIALQQQMGGAQVTVTLVADVNGPRPQTVTPISGGFLAGLRPYEHRVQFAGRIGHWDQTIDLDNIQIQLARGSGGFAEEFDLSSHLDVLRPGTNVLAIHGLNRSAEDPSFLLLPELAAGYGSVQTNALRYFATATPRGLNGLGHTGIASPPIFSSRGGVFSESVSVQIRAEGGEVRYTRDGSEPGPESLPYTGPIALSGTTLLRAKTFAPGRLPSATVTETYTLLDDDLADFTSNLPLVILNPFQQYISTHNRPMVSMRFIDVDGKSGRSVLRGEADFAGRATVNVRGFSTLRQLKNSYTVRFRDENQDKIKAGLFGLPKESDWVLYAPFSDKSLIRDALAYDLSNKMGRYAPRTRFVELFLDRSGGRLSMRDYMGVYVLIEKIKRGKSRVNIAELTPTDNAEPAITGGYIFKRDHSQRWEPGFTTGRRCDFTYVEPEADELTREQKTWLSRYMNQFERALYGPDFADPARGYAAYLDVDAFIDQHWLIELSRNIDGFRYSAFFHKDRGGKLVAGPAWDWNLSFGNADYHDGWKTDDWYTDLLRESEICWFRRLREDPEFMQRAIDRWAELRQGPLATATVLARIDAMAAQLDEAQGRNFRRWPLLGRNIHPNYYVGRTYEDEIQWMKKWIRQRLAWIDGEFLAPPAASLPAGPVSAGTKVTLQAPRGRIYCTLDGTDPREHGGEVSKKARAYSGGITLNGKVSLVARARQNNSWSGPLKVTWEAR
jgi:hypothetical protein